MTRKQSEVGRARGARITSHHEALVTYINRGTDNYMATWKVIETVSGNIEAVSGPAAQGRPGTHEWMVWEWRVSSKSWHVQWEVVPPR